MVLVLQTLTTFNVAFVGNSTSMGEGPFCEGKVAVLTPCMN